MLAHSPFIAAVVQACPADGAAATIDKLTTLTAEAASRGAKLVVFPEAFIGGYPKGSQFGASLGIRTPEGREQFRRYFDGAIDVPGPGTERLGRAARSSRVYLVVGVIERERRHAVLHGALLRARRRNCSASTAS